MTRRRTALFAALLVAAGSVVLFRPALFGSETFVARDLDSFYRPAKLLTVRLAREAHGLPLWNPYFSFGQPFAANPEHELFHPATTLLFLLPFEWAFRLPILVAPLLAALAMFFFLRTTGRSAEASAIGALSWGFGGYLLSTLNLLPFLYAAVPLPAALAFLLRAWRSGAWKDAAGFALAGGLVGLAGEPFTLLVAALLAVTTVAAHGGRPARPVAPLLGALLAFGIAAPALIPAALHVRQTVRAAGLPAAAASEWAFPLVRLAELAFPRIHGHVDTRLVDAWYWGHGLYLDRGFPFLLGIYPGILASALALFAACRLRRRVVPWTLTALVGIAVAVGPALPLWPALRVLPLFSGLRFPEKALHLTCFALPVLAAAGWDLARHGAFRRRVALALTAFAALAAGAALAFVVLPAPASLVAPATAGFVDGVLRRDFLAAAIAGALSALALALARRHRAPLALAVLALDLVVCGLEYAPTRPIALVRRPPPALAPLVAHPPPGPIVPANVPAITEPRPAAWGIATALVGDFDLTNLAWTDRAITLFWKAAAADPALLPHLLVRRGVSFLVTQEPAGGVRYGGPATAAPFAFFASRVVPLASEASWPDAVRALGAAAGSAVCLDAAEARGLPRQLGAGRVTRLERAPGEVTLDVALAGEAPGLLAVNQTWAAGWTADVDGRPARPLRVDVDLTALVVPAGARRVTLRYDDPSVRASVGIALAALAAVAALVLAGARRAP